MSSLKQRYMKARKRLPDSNDKAIAVEIGVHHNTLQTWKSGGSVSASTIHRIEKWVLEIEEESNGKE